MAEPSNEDIVRRYLAAHTAHDFDTLRALRDPDWMVEWPQSGERVRGDANDRAIMENWPGGTPNGLDVRIVGSEDRWVTTPLNTVHRVVGSGDFWWMDGTTAYPDGSNWFVSGLLQLRSAKLYREAPRSTPPRGEQHGSSGSADHRARGASRPQRGNASHSRRMGPDWWEAGRRSTAS